MPVITTFEPQSPVTVGVATTSQLASTPTGGGTLRGELYLAPSNDLYFGAPPNKTMSALPNGQTTYTLVRGPGQHTPVSPRLTARVYEAGVNLRAARSRLITVIG